MAVTVTLNGTDMMTYGLHLQAINGDHNLPARKQTTETWYFTANDIKYQDKDITFEFVGVYESALDLGGNIINLNFNIIASAEGVITVDTGRGVETYIGRLVNGTTVRIEKNTVAFVKIVMTWQGKTA